MVYKPEMKRVTVRLTEYQVEQIDKLVEGGEFLTRSEAIRRAVREYINNNTDNWVKRYDRC